MESVLRGVIVYFFLLLLFRLAGKRTLSEATGFDLILILIISETIQQAMVNGDHSLTNGFLLIMTLVGSNIFLSLIKQRFPAIEKWLEGIPLVVVNKGEMVRESMNKVRVDEADILDAARSSHGLERMDQIKYAIVERNGSISIVPFEK
ncbi:MAG: DUF421 domain-containing protein [Verrucomicrobiota bacterium]|nr:DUF421 domain-containing protein [Verrucomicrobiota bacterium]